MSDFASLCHVIVNYVAAFPAAEQHRVLFLWGDKAVDKTRPLHELLGKNELELAIIPEQEAWTGSTFEEMKAFLAKVFKIESNELKAEHGTGYLVCRNDANYLFGVNFLRKRMTTKGFFLEDAFGRVNNARQWLKVKVFIHTFQRPKRVFQSLKDAL